VKIIDPGHDYRMVNYDATDEQRIYFMKRIGAGYPNNTGISHGGTNCQEALRVLIDRVKYLQCVNIPHTNNPTIIAALRLALLKFEQRAAERHGYGSETQIYLTDLYLNQRIEFEPTCARCGHIICRGHQ
jgi:hypothetical protein